MQRLWVVLAVGASTLVASCSTWRSRPTLAAAAPTSRPNPTFRVTGDEGARRLILRHVTLRSDSVIGYLVQAERRLPNGWSRDSSFIVGARVAIATSDVDELQETVPSTGRTMLLFAVLSFIAWSILEDLAAID